MHLLFGPYGCLLSQRGISSHPSSINGVAASIYRFAVEEIAREYLQAGATLPTVNAFFLRSVLHEGGDQLYQELLKLNFEALLSVLGDRTAEEILICLGPAQDCYRPELAPDCWEACRFAERQYKHCLKVTKGYRSGKIAVLHETIGTLREAMGISMAAKSLDLPVYISFVVTPEGVLLDGSSVEKAIAQIDAKTEGFVRGFSLNCCSPFAFERAVSRFYDRKLMNRIVGFYPNSWDVHPAQYETSGRRNEPDKAQSLKRVVEIGRRYGLQFVGGCCGFDYNDVQALAQRIH